MNRDRETAPCRDGRRNTRGEYGHRKVHTNTVEGCFSVFERGRKGIYQRCSKRHVHRYAAEFAFRCTNRIARGVDDAERADIALRSVKGKRLQYA